MPKQLGVWYSDVHLPLTLGQIKSMFRAAEPPEMKGVA